MPIDSIMSGLEFAAQDYARIAKSVNFDVKPKEDQIKCGLYRALSEAGYLVHVEAAYARNETRCDMMAIRDEHKIAIEIKTAWAGRGGWINKPVEQADKWSRDIEKLMVFAGEELIDTAYFIICFAYEHGSPAEEKLREKIKRIGSGELLCKEPIEISCWNGLNRIQFFVFQVFDGRK
jgi:hypothetical protein